MCLLTFIYFLPQLQGFPNISPWGYFRGGGGLILGVKNKLRNAWAYFRGRAYIRGAYFRGFTVFGTMRYLHS